jgi:hypothetical protein
VAEALALPHLLVGNNGRLKLLCHQLHVLQGSAKQSGLASSTLARLRADFYASFEYGAPVNKWVPHIALGSPGTDLVRSRHAGLKADHLCLSGTDLLRQRGRVAASGRQGGKQ